MCKTIFSGSCSRTPVIRSATFTTAPRKMRWRRRPMSLRRMILSAARPDEVHTMFLTTRGLVLRAIMLGRDHHDVSGTDSPFRETSNIKDGSNVMADMAVQCFAGNCARGMSLVALHNGGGVGIGKAVNGGFGMVCDGSDRVDAILRSSMLWDVMGGVARRSWARNPHAMETSEEFNHTHREQGYHITMPHLAEDALIDRVLKEKGIKHQ